MALHLNNPMRDLLGKPAGMKDWAVVHAETGLFLRHMSRTELAALVRHAAHAIEAGDSELFEYPPPMVMDTKGPDGKVVSVPVKIRRSDVEKLFRQGPTEHNVLAPGA